MGFHPHWPYITDNNYYLVYTVIVEEFEILPDVYFIQINGHCGRCLKNMAYQPASAANCLGAQQAQCLLGVK